MREGEGEREERERRERGSVSDRVRKRGREGGREDTTDQIVHQSPCRLQSSVCFHTPQPGLCCSCSRGPDHHTPDPDSLPGTRPSQAS